MARMKEPNEAKAFRMMAEELERQGIEALEGG
jgi:hypothetical protein